MAEQKYAAEVIPELGKTTHEALTSSIFIYQYTYFSPGLCPEFFVVTDSDIFSIEPKGMYNISEGHVKRDHELDGDSLYTLAKLIATEGKPVRLFPANQRVEQQLRESFAELKLEDQLKGNTIKLKLINPPRRTNEFDVITLDYTPLEGLAEALAQDYEPGQQQNTQ